MSEPVVYTVGGTVQAGGGLYIQRQADSELLELCRRGAYAYVLTTRQLGKSSLIVNTARRLAAEGVHPVIVDLTQLGSGATAEQWLFGLLDIVSEKLHLTTDLDEWWESRPQLGVVQRLTAFLEQVALAETEGRIVIFLDEIDATLRLAFRDEFFGAIRYLYNSRATQPALARLSFVFVGVATPMELVADSTRTPFNIGARVELDDFTPEQARPLAAGMGLPEAESRQVLEWIMAWTAGHPYLTVKLCDAVARGDAPVRSQADIDALVRQTFMDAGREDSNIQYARQALTKRAAPEDRDTTLHAYRDVVRGRPRLRDEPQSPIVANLKLSGVVASRDGYLTIRNRIYSDIFTLEWVSALLPLRRWWAKVPKSIKIAAALIFCLLVALSGISIYASRQKELAEQALEEAESGRFASQGNHLLDDGEVEPGLLLAIEAARLHDSPDTYDLLRRAIAFPDHLIRAFYYGDNWQMSGVDFKTRWMFQMAYGGSVQGDVPGRIDMAWSPTGHTLVMRTPQSVHEWDVDNDIVRNATGGEAPHVGWSPNGRWRWEAVDGTIELFDIQSDRQMTLPYDGNLNIPPIQPVWSPDERWVVLVSSATVSVWDLATETSQVVLEDQSVNGVEWNSASSLVLVKTGFSQRVIVWNPLQGRQIQDFAHRYRGFASWIGADNHILIVLDDGLHVYDAISGQQRAPYNHEVRASVTLNEAGNAFLERISSISRTDVRDVTTGELQFSIPGRDRASVRDATWSPDSTLILVQYGDPHLEVWTATGALLSSVSLLNPLIYAGWNPVGRFFTTIDGNVVRVWDASTGQERHRFVHPATVTQIAWSPDGSLLATYSAGAVRVWATETEPENPNLLHGSRVIQAIWGEDNDRIITVSTDNLVHVWNTTTVQETAVLDYDSYVPGISTLDGDGRSILIANNDGTVRLMSVKGDDKDDEVVIQHYAYAYHAEWNENKSQVLTVGQESGTGRDGLSGQARISEVDTGETVLSLDHTGWVSSARWNKDESLILTTGDDGVLVWNAASAQIELRIPASTPYGFRQAAWNPDETLILTANAEGAQIWSAASGSDMATLEHYDGAAGFRTSSMVRASWSPDGQQIVTWGASDNRVIIWGVGRYYAGRISTISLHVGEKQFVLDGDSEILGVSWHPTENLVLANTKNGWLYVWDAETGQERFSIRFSENASSSTRAHWSPDGHAIMAIDGESVELFYAEIERLIEVACNRTARNLSLAEWTRYMGDAPYRPTCPDKPYQNEFGKWVLPTPTP